MKITLAQIAPKLSLGNIELHLDIINEYKSKSDVIVFPELSLHGYLLQDKVYENAYELEAIETIIEASKEVDIVLGMALKESKAIYNAALYLSQGQVDHIHRKNHLPNYGMFEEARYFFKGETTEMFDTKFGASMLVVCEDLWRASIISTIAENKPKYLYVIANSPARDFSDEGLLIEAQWNSVLKSTALLSGTTVIFVNRTGFEDGLGFWGGSSVIAPNTEVLQKCQHFKSELLTIDTSKSLFEASRMIMKHG
jgi:predicted amidohydrolase